MRIKEEEVIAVDDYKKFISANILPEIKKELHTKKKEAFLQGIHPRLGEESPIMHFSKNPLFDRSVLTLLFEFDSIADTEENSHSN